jgi:hypothetical protein
MLEPQKLAEAANNDHMLMIPGAIMFDTAC